MPSRTHAARVLLFVAVGTLALAPLCCNAARAGEVARMPVDGPTALVIRGPVTVSYERDDDGTARIILEFPPGSEVPPVPGVPGPDPAAVAVDRGLGAIPKGLRPRVLEQFAEEVEYALGIEQRAVEAGKPSGFADVDEAVRLVLSRSVFNLSDAGSVLASQLATMADALREGPADATVGDRLRALRAIIGERR